MWHWCCRSEDHTSGTTGAAPDHDPSCGFPEMALAWLSTSLSSHQCEKSVYKKKKGGKGGDCCKFTENERTWAPSQHNWGKSHSQWGSTEVGTGKSGRWMSGQKGTESTQALGTSPLLWTASNEYLYKCVRMNVSKWTRSTSKQLPWLLHYYSTT